MANIKLTPEQADALLLKLSTDETFRTMFQNDPEGALKQLPGPPIQVPPGPPGSSCMRPNKLLAADKLAASREALKQSLTGEGSFIPHLVDSAPSA